MDDKKNNMKNLTVDIADVSPFKIQIPQNEESFYTHIIEKVNRLWNKIHYGMNASTSDVALAKTALYFAEMYYRKSAILNEQGKMLEDFEARLDKLLREMEL